MAFKTICVDHVGIACAGTLEEAAKISPENANVKKMLPQVKAVMK